MKAFLFSSEFYVFVQFFFFFFPFPYMVSTKLSYMFSFLSFMLQAFLKSLMSLDFLVINITTFHQNSCFPSLLEDSRWPRVMAAEIPPIPVYLSSLEEGLINRVQPKWS